MALRGYGSWRALAARTDWSESTLRGLGLPRATATSRHLREIAAACQVPYEWFTVPSIQAAVQEQARRLESGRRAPGEPAPTDEEQRAEDGDDDDEEEEGIGAPRA